MQRFDPRAAALALVLAIGASAGCAKKAGDSCSGGVAVCLDGKTQLVCDGGKYLASPCSGAQGCRVEAANVLCDTSGNKVGDVCAAADENEGACAPDGKSLIECSKRSFRVLPCNGPDGCVAKAGNLACDRRIAAEGEPCTGAGSACSLDGQRALGCTEGKRTVSRACRGPEHCKVIGQQVACDTTVAEVGDVCEAGGACSVDGKAMLVCRDGKMAVHAVCRGAAGGCNRVGAAIRCADPTVAEVGDPCSGDIAACSVAHDAFLACKDGAFAVDTKCKCAAVGDGVGCP